MRIASTAIVLAVLSCAAVAPPALAVTTYGVPIQSLSLLNTTPVGSVTNNDIKFFIPLAGEEYYNNTGGGQSSDTCTNPDGCVGGSLHMYLQYSPVFPASPADSVTVNLLFTDLDLSGAPSINWNDPAGFFEKLIFYDDKNPKNVVAEIDNLSDVGGNVHSIVANPVDDTVLIAITLTGVTDPFRAELLLSSYSSDTYTYTYYTTEKEWVPGAWVKDKWGRNKWVAGHYVDHKVPHIATHGGIQKKTYNTVEFLKTWIDSEKPTQEEGSPVPLPAALPLLTAALAGFGAFGWRRRAGTPSADR